MRDIVYIAVLFVIAIMNIAEDSENIKIASAVLLIASSLFWILGGLVA